MTTEQTVNAVDAAFAQRSSLVPPPPKPPTAVGVAPAPEPPAPVTPLRVLTRADILAVNDRKVERVDVPEWDGAVWVRSLEGVERDQYEAGMVSYKRGKKGIPEVDQMELGNLRARLASMAMVESDKPDALNLFTPAEALILGHKSAAALNRVFEVAQRLSGLSSQDVEDLLGELGKDPSADSGSD